MERPCRATPAIKNNSTTSILYGFSIHYRLCTYHICKAFSSHDFADALSNMQIVETLLNIHYNGPSIGPIFDGLSYAVFNASSYLTVTNCTEKT